MAKAHNPSARWAWKGPIVKREPEAPVATRPSGVSPAATHRKASATVPAGPGWIFYLDTNAVGSAASGTATVSHYFSNASLVSQPTLRRNAQFALYDLVSKLPSLPPGHPMAVDSDAADAALRVLEYLVHFDQPSPTMFTHGGDAVVLKWDRGDVTQYLTIGGPEVGLMDMHKVNREISCEAEYDLNDEQQRSLLLDAVGGTPSSSSTLLDAT